MTQSFSEDFFPPDFSTFMKSDCYEGDELRSRTYKAQRDAIVGMNGITNIVNDRPSNQQGDKAG